jgi:hypothetical protein
MTTVLGRDDETVIVGVMTDSLRRASPARFSGFYLSRCCRAGLAADWAAPQPPVNFGPRPCRCKDFLDPASCCVQPLSGTPRNPREPPLRSSTWFVPGTNPVAKLQRAVRWQVGKAETPRPGFGVTISRSSRVTTSSTPAPRPAGWRDSRNSHPSCGARQGRSLPQVPTAAYDPIPA